MFGDIRLSDFMVSFKLFSFVTYFAIWDQQQIFVIREIPYYWNKIFVKLSKEKCIHHLCCIYMSRFVTVMTFYKGRNWQSTIAFYELCDLKLKPSDIQYQSEIIGSYITEIGILSVLYRKSQPSFNYTLILEILQSNRTHHWTLYNRENNKALFRLWTQKDTNLAFTGEQWSMF